MSAREDKKGRGRGQSGHSQLLVARFAGTSATKSACSRPISHEEKLYWTVTEMAVAQCFPIKATCLFKFTLTRIDVLICVAHIPYPTVLWFELGSCVAELFNSCPTYLYSLADRWSALSSMVNSMSIYISVVHVAVLGRA